MAADTELQRAAAVEQEGPVHGGVDACPHRQAILGLEVDATATDIGDFAGAATRKLGFVMELQADRVSMILPPIDGKRSTARHGILLRRRLYTELGY